MSVSAAFFLKGEEGDSVVPNQDIFGLGPLQRDLQ